MPKKILAVEFMVNVGFDIESNKELEFKDTVTGAAVLLKDIDLNELTRTGAARYEMNLNTLMNENDGMAWNIANFTVE